MTATITDITERMNAAGDRVRKTIHQIKAYRHLNDTDLAVILGMKRSTVQSYTGGPTKFTAEMIAAFAAALEVPDFVLAMDPDEALRWVLEHSPRGDGGTSDLGDSQSRRIANRTEPARVLPLRSAATRAA